MKPNSSATHGGAHWRAEEDTQIEDAVRDGLEFLQICAFFPSRTPEAVRHRISKARRIVQTGKPIDPKTATQELKSGRPWTIMEDETLDKAIINGDDLSRIRTLFPERSADAVRHRYNRNLEGMNSRDADLLVEDAQTKGSQHIATLKAGRSNKAAALWTPEDDQKVGDAVSANIDRSEIAAMFPQRTVAAVETRIRKITKTLPKEDSAPAPRGKVVLANQPQFSRLEDDSVRFENAEKNDYDFVRGSMPEDEDFVMSGALPVISNTSQASSYDVAFLDSMDRDHIAPAHDNEKGKPVSFEDEHRIPGVSRSPYSVRPVTSFKAQLFQGPMRPSTPPRPVVEPLTPPFRAQELPAIEEHDFPFGVASYQPYPEDDRMLEGNSYDQAFDIGMLLTETRAWLNSEPENQSPGNASQEQHYPVLAHGRIGNIPLTALFSPPEPFMSFPTDNGYGQDTSTVGDGPELQNSLDWALTLPELHNSLDGAPTLHRPDAPSTLETSVQLFTDPSVPPSYFMDMDDTQFTSYDHLMDEF
ncbi:hypothetical protein SLS60_003990 [Paraconiothyrium brasiliense]|uniref:Myb-like domain-containing protein n=1 Tax=Paraconiothyrium brasiliense TaxID=300254 RepID=A0ABR3RQ91_9PLEO